MSGAKGFPHWVDFSVSLVDLKERGSERHWYFFLPTSLRHFFSSLLDAGVTRPGLETGMVPEQETVAVFLTFVSEFLRA